MELNNFDKALRDLAFKYAPKQLAKCGDIVTTQNGYWKRLHKVLITEVDVEVTDINLSIARRAELGIWGWLMVQHQYFGQRLKSNGERVNSSSVGFLIYDFTTTNGQRYKRIPSSFNHVGLVFNIGRYEA